MKDEGTWDGKAGRPGGWDATVLSLVSGNVHASGILCDFSESLPQAASGYCFKPVAAPSILAPLLSVLLRADASLERQGRVRRVS